MADRITRDGTVLKAVTIHVPKAQYEKAEKRIGRDRHNGRVCGTVKAVCEAILERALK